MYNETDNDGSSCNTLRRIVLYQVESLGGIVCDISECNLKSRILLFDGKEIDRENWHHIRIIM